MVDRLYMCDEEAERKGFDRCSPELSRLVGYEGTILVKMGDAKGIPRYTLSSGGVDIDKPPIQMVVQNALFVLRETNDGFYYRYANGREKLNILKARRQENHNWTLHGKSTRPHAGKTKG